MMGYTKSCNLVATGYKCLYTSMDILYINQRSVPPNFWGIIVNRTINMAQFFGTTPKSIINIRDEISIKASSHLKNWFVMTNA